MGGLIMDIDRLQRKDIDDAANDRITLAIDAISTMESPYILDDVDGYKGSNWLLAGEKYVKYNIAEEDSLVFLYGPVRDLSEKNIICITVSFDYLLDEYVAPIVLDNISLIHDSVDFTITGLELNGEGHMDVNCSLFGIDNHVLNGIISGEGFGIGLNFKGNNSNASVSIGNVKLVFEYDDDLQDEINAVANRFIAGLSASRNDDVSDDVNTYKAIMDLFTGSDDSGVVDTALDSSSSNPVANSVITNEFNTKRNIQRTLVYNADSTLEEGHYYYTGGIVNPGQNQGVSFLDVSVNPQYDNMITQVCYEYDYGESFDNDVHQYIRYSTDGGTNWSSWKRFAEESEINSLSGSITNLAETTSWKYYINNNNYKVRYNDYRVNVDVSILGTSATTALTSYGAKIIPNELRPRYPVSAFSHNTDVLLQIKDNDTKLYRRSMTGSNQSNINIYAHLEWDRR